MHGRRHLSMIPDMLENGFVQRLVHRLDSGDMIELRNALSDASELARIWRRFGGDPARARARGCVGPFGCDAEYPFVQSADADLLLQILCVVIQRSIAPTLIGTAAHALGELANPAARPALTHALRRMLDRTEMAACFQILLALEALGDDVFPPALMSRSFDADDTNRDAATRYLRRSDGA